MTQDEQTLFMFKGIVAELSEQSRAKVEHCLLWAISVPNSR
ncbi:hypothetical protein ACJZSO_003298 [Proteus mirabilis]|nr:hypothetical protein [Proteus mirabilis]SPY42565.1 Uncharacterised protein [Proteus mirabilis]